jgi:hypothetical protein
MPFFNYPSFLKALHRPQGVRIVEFEAIRRKYVNFLDFDFFLILLYAKKKQKNNKKNLRQFTWTDVQKPFGLTKLICWYVFIFDISFFKYNTDGIWVWKCQTRCKYNCRYLFFVSKHYNSLFLFVILSLCNLNCI